MFRSLSFVALFLVALIVVACFSRPAEAHHGGFVRSNNVFVVRGGPVRSNNVVIQQTNRGFFGRVRSQTTIIGR